MNKIFPPFGPQGGRIFRICSPVHRPVPGVSGFLSDAFVAMGLGLTAACIPLFVIPYKYKKKAKQAVDVSLEASNILMSLPNGDNLVKPALGVSLIF